MLTYKKIPQHKAQSGHFLEHISGKMHLIENVFSDKFFVDMRDGRSGFVDRLNVNWVYELESEAE